MSASLEERTRDEASFVTEGRVKPDVKAGVVGLLFCAVAFAGTFTFESVPDELIQGPGAATFPRLVIGIIAVLCGVLIWRGRNAPYEPLDRVDPMSLATIAAGAVFMALVPVIGMLGAMLAVMIGIGRMWGAPRWLTLLIVASVTVGLVYLLFSRLFRIPIPSGLLAPLIG